MGKFNVYGICARNLTFPTGTVLCRILPDDVNFKQEAKKIGSDGSFSM